MNNKSKMTEISAKPAKEKKLGWQKIAIIAAAALLVAGLGTFVAIELINRNNNSTSEEIVETAADTENYFESAPKYTLELKDGENKITEPGVYTITGSSNGYIHVNTGDSKVKLILSGVTIKNSSGAAIYVESNGNVHIETVGENNLSATATEDIDAAIYSKADLVFKGDGTLNIESSIDGIHGKDDVKIKSGTINVTATEDGIKGKDSLTIEGGDITVSAGDDGLKASNDEEEDKGILTTLLTPVPSGAAGISLSKNLAKRLKPRKSISSVATSTLLQLMMASMLRLISARKKQWRQLVTRTSRFARLVFLAVPLKLLPAAMA